MDIRVIGILIALVVVTSGCVDTGEEPSSEKEIEPSSDIQQESEKNNIEIKFGSNLNQAIIPDKYLRSENKTVFSNNEVSFTFQIDGVEDYEYTTTVFSKQDYLAHRTEGNNYREFISNDPEQVQEVCADQDETTIIITCGPENLELDNLENYIFTVVVESGNISNSNSVEFSYSSPAQIGETIESQDFSVTLDEVNVKDNSDELMVDYSIESDVEEKLDTEVYLVDDRSTPGSGKVIDSFNLTVENNVGRQDSLEFSEEDYPSHVVFQVEGNQSYLATYDLGDVSAEIDDNTEFITEGETYSTDKFEFSIDSIRDYEDETVDGLNKVEFDYYFENKGVPVTEARDGIGAEISLREDRERGNVDYIRIKSLREGQSTDDSYTLEYVDGDNPQYLVVDMDNFEGPDLILKLENQ